MGSKEILKGMILGSYNSWDPLSLPHGSLSGKDGSTWRDISGHGGDGLVRARMATPLNPPRSGASSGVFGVTQKPIQK